MHATTNTSGLLARDPQVSALWEKLRYLAFDSGDRSPGFAARLSSEQGWPADFTAQAIEEYRRFLLLFALEQGRVTSAAPAADGAPAVRIVPSAVVDKVWHLHLLYTRSYWDALCRDVVGAPLHHVPAEGGGGEAALLDTVYRDTLARYRQVFGHQPPASVWPVPVAARTLPRPLPASGAAAPRRVYPGGSAQVPFLPIAAGIAGIIGVLFAQMGGSASTVILAVIGCAVFACILLVATSRPGREASGPGGGALPRRRRLRTAASDSGSGGDTGGWVAGGIDGNSGSSPASHTGTHHDSGGHHDGGSGHGHSCGGHGCGGHSCGGHGCGGH